MYSANVSVSTGFLNVYRTRDFIVEQDVRIQYDRRDGNLIVSHDKYFRRTPKLDADYERLFIRRIHVDGKRFPTSMYTREYVEDAEAYPIG